MTNLRQAAQQAVEACEQRLPLNGQAAIIDELNNLRTALEQQAEPDRRDLQAAGTHPPPCARHCEAKAFEIEIRSLKSRLKQAEQQIAEALRQHGLSLVKTADGYSVMKLGPITAHNLENT